MAKVLLIDAETEVQQAVRSCLQEHGHSVIVAEDGDSGLSKSFNENPDIILLDLMLSGVSGIEVCKCLRRNPGTLAVPIIILTTRKDVSDLLIAFESGADDYMVKPFSPNELGARIKARLREKQRHKPNTNASRICLGELEIWPDNNMVFLSGNPVNLTQKEFDLMNTFILNPNRIVSREYLLHVIWGSNTTESNRKIDVHVKNLRTKLEKIGTRIETIRGIGYRFRPGKIEH